MPWYSSTLFDATIAYFSRPVRGDTAANLPLHPDQCGGLRPVGEPGLRNQYTLTLPGLNIVILFWCGCSISTATSRSLILILARQRTSFLGPAYSWRCLPFEAQCYAPSRME